MTAENPVCPYLNDDDQRCTKRLTLVNLRQAFGFCLGSYARCAVYQQMRREQELRENARQYARPA